MIFFHAYINRTKSKLFVNFPRTNFVFTVTRNACPVLNAEAPQGMGEGINYLSRHEHDWRRVPRPLLPTRFLQKIVLGKKTSWYAFVGERHVTCYFILQMHPSHCLCAPRGLPRERDRFSGRDSRRSTNVFLTVLGLVCHRGVVWVCYSWWQNKRRKATQHTGISEDKD